MEGNKRSHAQQNGAMEQRMSNIEELLRTIAQQIATLATRSQPRQQVPPFQPYQTTQSQPLLQNNPLHIPTFSLPQTKLILPYSPPPTPLNQTTPPRLQTKPISYTNQIPQFPPPTPTPPTPPLLLLDVGIDTSIAENIDEPAEQEQKVDKEQLKLFSPREEILWVVTQIRMQSFLGDAIGITSCQAINLEQQGNKVLITREEPVLPNGFEKALSII